MSCQSPTSAVQSECLVHNQVYTLQGFNTASRRKAYQWKPKQTYTLKVWLSSILVGIFLVHTTLGTGSSLYFLITWATQVECHSYPTVPAFFSCSHPLHCIYRIPFMFFTILLLFIYNKHFTKGNLLPIVLCIIVYVTNKIGILIKYSSYGKTVLLPIKKNGRRIIFHFISINYTGLV